jgi:hypothetical protein
VQERRKKIKFEEMVYDLKRKNYFTEIKEDFSS